MRTVGLDLGEKNLGVAVSDEEGLIAVPHSVLSLTGDDEADLKNVISLTTELCAKTIVVGFPISLSGKIGPAADLAKKYVERLQARVDVPVVLHDERFTTTEANKLLKKAGEANKKSSLKKDRQKVDMVAASIILQSWLDSNIATQTNDKRAN